ncbi:NUMOD3 domain-containing DNA-binding protein [Enterococcus thailandicus]
MDVPINAYGFIYITTNLLNGKKYLGQKKIDEFGVWKKYLGSGKAFKKAVIKYGKENFCREIIAFAYSSEELNKLEEKFTHDLNCVADRNFYNLVLGGGTVTGLKFSEDVLSKMRKRNAGENNYFYGKRYVGALNPFFGKKHTIESRQKMSLSHKGQSPWNKGRNNVYSDETLEKMSLSKKGKKISDEHKAAIRKAQSGVNHPMYGKHHSEETKQILREKAVGKKISEVTRNKMSLSQKRRFKEHPETLGKHAKSVICLTTGEIFESIKVAASFYSITSSSDISRVCRGRRKTAGKLADGTKLTWSYYK